MTTVTPTRRYTPEELLTMDDAGHYELVDRCLVERNVSKDSSRVAVRIARRLSEFVDADDLGDVYEAELGMRVFADIQKVRRPDVAFLVKERAPLHDVGYLRVPPDLVVEVVSPGDVADEVRANVDEWLGAGVRCVWVAFPRAHEVHVYRANGHHTILGGNDEISGEDYLPGFTCPVAQFFPARRAAPTPAS